MTAQLTNSYNSTRYNFQVTHEGITYDVSIWCNSKGKFIDDEITLNGDELDGEGIEGDIQEAITDYLADNWESIVKE